MRTRTRKYMTGEERRLGFKSMPFNARFDGGKCGLCLVPHRRGEPAVYFRDKGMVHNVCANRVCQIEDDLRSDRFDTEVEYPNTLPDATNAMLFEIKLKQIPFHVLRLTALSIVDAR